MSMTTTTVRLYFTDPDEIQKRLDALPPLDLESNAAAAAKVNRIYSALPAPYNWSEYHSSVNIYFGCIIFTLLGFLPVAHIVGWFPPLRWWSYATAGGTIGALAGITVGGIVVITPFYDALESLVKAVFDRIFKTNNE